MKTNTHRMDDIAIGPAGETFAQLKERVLESRAALLTAFMRGHADDGLIERHQRNVNALDAAYGRVGLAYQAP